MGSAPQVVMIAGPNGAGKTTASLRLLETWGIKTFVNADQIAVGLTGGVGDAVAVAAGRIMLERLYELAADRVDFGFETTLASRSFAPWIKSLIGAGYTFHLEFLWLNSADLAVERVRRRVRSGGHAVPEETIQRRYERGIENFFQQYLGIATSWTLWDNSDGTRSYVIAEKEAGRDVTVMNDDAWKVLHDRYSK